MRRLFGLWVLILIVSSYSYSQSFTTVTGATITDSNGQVWSNMTVVANLIPPNGSSLGRLKNQGFDITDTPQYVLGDSSGNFSLTLDDNSKITPSGSFWRLSLCSNTSSSCSTLDIQVSGASMNITTQVQNAISVPSPNSTTTITRGYNVNEVKGGNGSFFWRTTDNTLWGCQTTPNSSCPPGWVQIAVSAASLPTATKAGQEVVSTSAGSLVANYTAQDKSWIDPRDYGVDCSDTNDSTTAWANAVTAAGNYGKILIPEHCLFRLSGAIGWSLYKVYGLQVEAAGRNGNGCDNQGPNPAGIDYRQAYAGGNTVISIMDSQRLLFSNFTIFTNGGADNGILIDQDLLTPPINTRNDFYNICIYNNTSTRNSSWRGINISPVSISNVENIHFYHPDITCSASNATSNTSNGYAILFGPSANLKNEIIDDYNAHNCSQDVVSQSGGDISFLYGLSSNSNTNIGLGSFNDLLWGFRTENATTAVAVSNSIGPHLIAHNDFAASGGTIVDCASGCGFLSLINNQQDNASITTADPHSGGGHLFAVNNRNTKLSPIGWNDSFVMNGGASSPGAYSPDDWSWITGSWRFTPNTTATGGIGLTAIPSAGLLFDTLKFNAGQQYDHFVLQASPQSSNSDVGMAINYLGTHIGYLGLGGVVNGIKVGPQSQTAASLPTISFRGTPGSTSISYLIQANTINGHSDCSAVSTALNGPATLNTTNYEVITWDAYAGALSYNVYRTATGGLPATTGLIGVVPAYWLWANPNPSGGGLAFADQGATGDGTTCTAGNTIGDAQFGRHLTQIATGNWAGTCAMSAGTSCTVTLSAAYASTPGCVVTVQGGTPIAGSCSVSGTTVTITAASANSATWAALLFGNPN